MSTATLPVQLVEAQRNTELMRRLIEEGFNQGNLAVVDEIVAPNAQEHQFFGPNHPAGPDGVKAVIKDLHRLFAGFRLTIEDLVSDGDTVWVRMTGRGIHQGEFLGRPPTGKEIQVTVVDICRFEGGKMVEHWGVPDRFHLMVQLGFVPMGPGAPA